MKLNIENKNMQISRNIIMRKDGRYMCYAQLSTIRKAVYGKIPDEADKKAEALEEKDRIVKTEEVKYSFGMFYQQWFITKMNTSIKPQSLDHIENTYIKYYKKELS